MKLRNIKGIYCEHGSAKSTIWKKVYAYATLSAQKKYLIDNMNSVCANYAAFMSKNNLRDMAKEAPVL